MTIVTDESVINTRPVFEAVLRPYRSLGEFGYRMLIGMMFVFCLFNVIFFLVTGALPVALFFGLDFVLLYGAFWLNNRAARAREEVTVSRTELAIRKYSPRGELRESLYNPFWAKFEVDRHHEFGIEAMAVSGQGRKTDIGSFLPRDDREDFAKAFGSALATVKRRL